jgi:hypothetical protein
MANDFVISQEHVNAIQWKGENLPEIMEFVPGGKWVYRGSGELVIISDRQQYLIPLNGWILLDSKSKEVYPIESGFFKRFIQSSCEHGISSAQQSQCPECMAGEIDPIED